METMKSSSLASKFGFIIFQFMQSPTEKMKILAWLH